VLFLDIAGYSRLGVTDQIKLKQSFNDLLSSALTDIDARERVVIDTGDGAAVAFLGDPERALFAALAVFDNAGQLPVRMGINLGPVSLMKDINGLDNVVGDGINVAERVMGFANQGQVLVSRTFFEVVSLLTKDYAGWTSSFRVQNLAADAAEVTVTYNDQAGRQLLDDQAEADGGQQDQCLRPVAERPERPHQGQTADQPDHHHRDHQRQPEADALADAQPQDVGADHEKVALREVENAEHAEQQRQPGGHQRDRGPDHQPVEAGHDDVLHHLSPPVR